MFYSYQGHIGAALVLGGVDKSGPSLYSIYPHGSTNRLPYVTMGSGSLAAMSVFESGWKQDMTVRTNWSFGLNIYSFYLIARRRQKTCARRDCCWYLQRSRLRKQRWLVCDHPKRRPVSANLRGGQPERQKVIVLFFFNVLFVLKNYSFSRQGNYQYKRNTTAVLDTKVIPIDIESSQTFFRPIEGYSKKDSDKMDTSS